MINFNVEALNFKLKGKQIIKKWIKIVAGAESKKTGDLNYIFCSDDYLLEINKQYLGHDTYTDIITFDYSDGEAISGDIFISIDRVKENAENFKQPFEKELNRVIIHGVLHLCGYKDKTRPDKAKMREGEDKYLSIFQKL
jgi:probable rRNA maturation factor